MADLRSHIGERYAEGASVASVAVAVAILLGGFFLSGLASAAGPQIALLALIFGVAQMTPAPTPSGSTMYIGIGVAVVVPFLLLDSSDGFDVAGIGAVYCFGLAVAWLGRGVLTDSSTRRAMQFVSDAVAFAVYAWIVVAVMDLLLDRSITNEWEKLSAIAAGALGWFLARALARSLIGSERQDVGVRYLWLLSLEDWPVVISLFATGALFAFTYPVMGIWAVPVSLMPYGFTHLAFVQYARTRRTYGQTIKALARIPEVAGLSSEGHSVRTTLLAVAVGKELGMRPDEVLELEYAALMHDIGRITLNQPAIVKAGFTPEDIARWGSQIIAEAPYLQRVSELVRQQHDPYRQPGVDHDPEVPLASKVIKVASEYDRAVSEMRLPPLEALEQLHRESAYGVDPAVTASLRRVLVHRGVIAA